MPHFHYLTRMSRRKGWIIRSVTAIPTTINSSGPVTNFDVLSENCRQFYTARLLKYDCTWGGSLHSLFIIFLDFRHGEMAKMAKKNFAIDFAIFAIDFLAIFAIISRHSRHQFSRHSHHY